MAKRKLDNWLAGYRDYTTLVQESPPIFHLWTGLFTLASVTRRKIWIEHPPKRLYTNFYIVLVSPPGRSRKSSAMGLGIDFLKEIQGVNISAENITQEAMIQDLAGCADTFMHKGKLVTHSSLSVVSKELSVFIGMKNVKLLAVLCDLYDCHSKWTYKTKLSGTDHIIGEWLSIFGATTPDWLKTSLPIDAIGGGFTSRVIFVVCSERGKKIPRGTRPNEALILEKKLIHDLEIIATLSGEFQWSDDAGAFYDDWYLKYEVSQSDWWLVGYLERKPIHIIKIAMMLSIAESDSLIIELHHLKSAIQLLGQTELDMPSAFGGIGRSPTSQDIYKSIQVLKEQGSLPHSKLVEMLWPHVEVNKISEIIETLKQTRRIKVDIQNNEAIYHYIGPKREM